MQSQFLQYVADDRNSILFAHNCEKVIAKLTAKGECWFREIVRETKLSPRTVSKVTGRLVDAGALNRREDPDKGKVCYSLSDIQVRFRYIGRVRHRLAMRTIRDDKRQPSVGAVLRSANGRFSKVRVTTRLPIVVPRARLPRGLKVWEPPTFGAESDRSRLLNSGRPSLKQVARTKGNGPRSKTMEKLIRQVEENTATYAVPTTLKHVFKMPSRSLDLFKNNRPSTSPATLNHRGNCDRCHVGVMQKVQAWWCCSNCGAQRGGSYFPTQVDLS